MTKKYHKLLTLVQLSFNASCSKIESCRADDDDREWSVQARWTIKLARQAGLEQLLALKAAIADQLLNHTLDDPEWRETTYTADTGRNSWEDERNEAYNQRIYDDWQFVRAAYRLFENLVDHEIRNFPTSTT